MDAVAKCKNGVRHVNQWAMQDDTMMGVDQLALV
jgi:hypothetical protein